MLPLWVNFPSWLKPEIIPGLPIRWYGLMYIVAFGIAWFLYRRQVRERNFPIKEEELSGLFFWGILALVLGARLMAALVYSGDLYYREPWRIFWPFANGKFVGLLGMSYHGGVIGALIAVIGYSVKHRFDCREIGDMACASIPLGYTAGRLGNFINGELYGRVTAGPLGMIFPDAEALPLSEGWVRDIAEKAGTAVSGSAGFVNLPRHPSQLYEALFEGVVLWLVIWALRNKKPFKGFLMGIYLIGYGLVRFFIEYLREPDSDLGYRLELVKTGLPPALFTSPWNFSTGQLFCAAMIAGGLLWLFAASRLPAAAPVIFYPPTAVEEAAAAETAKKEDRKNRRKMRKKLG
ncbi:MAG: prolipoprotein diacylglyceryl transferase [Treponema sp.]|jgi:phosphatidylglycerol:prolipoprotein diacylglycerol transferase|nr:prolipoprotein diacylglyceryl transferase [Treponema sp.]